LARDLLSLFTGKEHCGTRRPDVMLTLTPNAADTIEKVIGRSAGAGGLRIKVESGGCAGLTYKMGLETAAGPDDTVIETGGARLFIDPESLRHLADVTVDFVENGVGGAGFRFDNPSAVGGCACGASFASTCAAAALKRRAAH
jgi:iron-sulfur cluster assembly protein